MTANNNSRANWDYLTLLAGAPACFRYVPVNGNKQPTGGQGWNTKNPLTLEEISQLNPEAAGLLLGPVSGGILDIDFDGPGSLECFQRELGHHVNELPKTIQWTSGKPGRGHRIFRVSPDNYKLIQHQRRDYKVEGETRLELRWDKHMSVICGTHPETGKYHFEEGCFPADVDVVPLAPDWLLKPLLVPKGKKGVKQSTDKQHEIELARCYLSQIDPLQCTDYNTWLKVLMALHSTSEDLLDSAIQWSSAMPNFDEEECHVKWKSFDPNGGVGIGTLAYLANGSTNPSNGMLHTANGFSLDKQERSESLSVMSSMSSMSSVYPMGIMENISQKHNDLVLFQEIANNVVSIYGTTGHVAQLLRQASSGMKLNLNNSEIEHAIKLAKRALDPIKEPIRGGDVISVEPMPWLLQDIILLSTINLLVALPKTGKTSFLISLLAAYINGESQYIGKSLHTETFPILIIGTDQPESDWARMLKRGGLIDSNNRLHHSIVALYTAGSPLYFDEEGFNTIEEYCKQHERLVIVADSYSRLTSLQGVAEKSEQYAAPMHELSKRIAPYSATAIVIHHSNKEYQEGSAALQSRGTTALPAAASQILSLTRISNSTNSNTSGGNAETYCRLKTEGRAGAPQELTLKSCSDGWELANSTELGSIKHFNDGSSHDANRALAYIEQAWSKYSAGVSRKSLAIHLGCNDEAGYKRTGRLLNKLHKSEKVKMKSVSGGFGKGAPTSLYVPASIAEEQLENITDIEDIKDVPDTKDSETVIE